MTADPKTNTQVVFVARPTGQLGEEHFELRQGPVPEVGENDVLVRNMYSSVEPYLRVLMTEDTPYAKKFDLDTVLPARVVGEVVESHHPDCGAGDFVYGMLNWEEYSVAVGGEGLRRVDPKLAPLSAYVGVLGPSGLTAYVSHAGGRRCTGRGDRVRVCRRRCRWAVGGSTRQNERGAKSSAASARMRRWPS